MAHKIETIAWTNEKPWHGLGVEVEPNLTAQEMMKAASLDWEVEKRPLMASIRKEGKTRYARVPDKYCVVRNTDDRVLGICGKTYKPVQNHQTFDFLQRFVSAGKATMETAGSLQDGRYVWGLARIGSDFNIDGDETRGYLLIASPHEPGKSLIIKTTAVRVVCNNTLSMAMSSGTEFRMSHRLEFGEDQMERAAEIIGFARSTMTVYERNVQVLMSINLSREDAIRILAPVYQPNRSTSDVLRDFNKNSGKQLAEVMAAYQMAPGATPGTAWGVLNAVTYHSDHIAQKSQDQRVVNGLMGTTSRRKTDVLTSLLELA